MPSQPRADKPLADVEDDQEHDVGRDLNPVQRRAGPLVVSPTAIAAPEAPEAMNRSPFPLSSRRRVAIRAVHGGSLDRSKRDREPIRW